MGVELIASDMFNRADNADLGTQWTAQTAFAMNLGNTGNPLANTARANALGDPSGEWNNTISVGAAQFACVELTSDIETLIDLGLGPAVRMADAADTSYTVKVNSNAAGRFELERRVAATPTILRGYTGLVPAGGQVVLLTIDRFFFLRVYVNGVEIIAWDDAAQATRIGSGRVGIFGHISGVVARVDNWEGGDLLLVQQPPNLAGRASYSVQ